MNFTAQSVDDLFQQGVAHAKSGRNASARRCFHQVVALSPAHEQAWLYLAGVAENAHTAEAALKQVEGLNPDNPRLAGAWQWAKHTWPDYFQRPGDGRRSARPAEVARRPASAKAKGRGWLNALAFLGQRLGFGALVLLSIIYLSRLGLDMARGAALAPALVQAGGKTVAYLLRLFQGDLGMTAAGVITGLPAPVADVVPGLLLKSFGLLAVSLLLAAVVGVTLGVLAAGRRRSGWSLTIIIASIIGVSIPSFFAAFLLQLLLIQWTRRYGSPLLPMGGFGWDKHLILPALVLAARPVAQITRVTFISVSEVFEQDFVRAARGKGLHNLTVLFRHVMRNAAIPILTTIGLSLRFSLSSLPVVEFFFGWPGLGFVLLKAISQQDDNLTVVLAMSLAVVFIVVNLLLDASYRLIDPRLRQTSARRVRRASGSKFRLADFWADLPAMLADNPLCRRLKRRKTETPPDFLKILSTKRGNYTATAPAGAETERRRALLRGTVGNAPFLAGGAIVLGLFLVFVFGPKLAPHSPYTTLGLQIVNGEFIVPPFAPDDVFVWGTDMLGRDVLSLVLAGAQQTLLLAALVVLARLALGFTLGAVAGWLGDTWLDRLILSAAEIIAAFPTLLLAMILILALGLRQGMSSFIIAMCFVGWGEVMQFVRSEVMSIRPKLFIESAIATGLRTPRIIRNHVLPNLISPLISITALEMGAVLMLLGELGFIGIFIGGGSFAELDIDMPPYHYSDVPEWGALLSNVRLYARAYPWTAIYPTLAFFTAILGFNLFGEGIRRLVEQVGVGINRLFNRYTISLAAVAIVAVIWVQNNTGAMPFYRRQAQGFDGRRAIAHVQTLTDPALFGRALGTTGLEQAAHYIAKEFEAGGLQPAGQQGTFLFKRNRSYEQLTALPTLNLEDGGPDLIFGQDFTAFPGYNRNIGQAEGAVRFFGAGELQQMGTFFSSGFLALKDKDFSEDIVLTLSAQDAAYAGTVPHAAILIVAEDEADLSRNYTYSSRDPFSISFGTNRKRGQDVPVLWISPAVADRILAPAGRSVAKLRQVTDSLITNQVLEFETPGRVAMSVEGTVVDKFAVNHVLGYWPGQGAKTGMGQVDNRMIVVVAPYDSPPPGPDGRFYPAANNNAAGVAVMLEAIRSMQESGYQPYKTFLFVAYSAEGLDGGEAVTLDPKKFLQAKPGFAGSYNIEAVIHLQGLGAGAGEGLALSTGGSLRLTKLFERAANNMGVATTRRDDAVNFDLVFGERSSFQSGQEAPLIGLSWQGGTENAGTTADGPDTVSADKLKQAGQTVGLALMVLGRELDY